MVMGVCCVVFDVMFEKCPFIYWLNGRLSVLSTIWRNRQIDGGVSIFPVFGAAGDWAKQAQGTIRLNEWWNMPRSGFEPPVSLMEMSKIDNHKLNNHQAIFMFVRRRTERNFNKSKHINYAQKKGKKKRTTEERRKIKRKVIKQEKRHFWKLCQCIYAAFHVYEFVMVVE